MFDGGVSWLFLAFGLLLAATALTAWAPFRREPLTVVSFALGWLAGELPVHMGVVLGAGTVALVALGGLGTPAGWAGLGLVALAAAVFVALAVVAHRSAGLVDAALAGASGGPVDAPGTDRRPVWARWWRLVLAVPFRFRRVRRIRNIDYWGDGNYRHKLDVLRLRSAPVDGAPVLVYIHGGAWIIGDKREQGVPMMHELVSRGWVCVAINYRLSPRATWPAHVVDCKRALAWVRAHIAEYGGDPSFVAVSGGSAGGHLAALVALTANQSEWQPGFEDADTAVDACVPFYGVYDVTGDPAASGTYGPGLVDLVARRVMKVAPADAPELFALASPDQRVTAAAPPMFVVQGANDTLVPPEVARRFVRRLREVSGAPVAFLELPRAQHAFDILVSIRSRHTTLGVVRFLEAVRSRAQG